MIQRFGFIGLGNLGQAFVENVLASGTEVGLWNRTKEKALAFEEKGVKVYDSIKELATAYELVVTLVSDDEALRAITFGEQGLLESLSPDDVHLSLATVSPEVANEMERRHQAKQVHYISGAVFGRPEAIRGKSCHYGLSGPEQSKKELCKKMLKEQAAADQVFDFGKPVHACNIMKISFNYLIAHAVEGMSETMHLVEKAGLDPKDFYNLFTNTAFGGLVYKGYGKKLCEKTYQPASFSMELGRKDVALAKQSAQSYHAQLDFVDTILHHHDQGIKSGRKDWDWAAFGERILEK